MSAAPSWLKDGWPHVWLPYTQMQGADVPGDYGDRVLGDPGKFRFVYLHAESRSLRYG